ncbi:MAG: M23 family metallopeptidase [Methylotenera sp.]|nr:M23 family metallopeptidase [Oligoflexia bacterium]
MFRQFKTTVQALSLILLVSASSPLQASNSSKDSFLATLSSSEVADGTLVLVTIKTPPKTLADAVSVTFEKTIYPVYALGETEQESSFRAVIAVPFNLKPSDAKVEVRLGKSIEAQSLSLPIKIVDGHYKSEILKVGGKFTNPKKKDLAFIKKDIAEVAAIYRKITPVKYWTGPFAYPVDSAMTSPFGTKRVFNGEMKSFHQGLDLRAKVGTPIYAAAPGVIALARDMFFTGNTILIDHGYGIYTLYAHMSALKVAKGQQVGQKELIGLAGKTGRASGPHLHWGAIVNKNKVNPTDLIQVLK